MTTFQAPEGSPQAMRHFPFPTCPRRRNERRSRRFAIDWIKPVPSDTMPLVSALLGGAFPKCSGAVGELNALQRQVLARMVNTEELWQIGQSDVDLPDLWASVGSQEMRRAGWRAGRRWTKH